MQKIKIVKFRMVDSLDNEMEISLCEDKAWLSVDNKKVFSFAGFGEVENFKTAIEELLNSVD